MKFFAFILFPRKDTPMINVGIIGAGSFGEAHARAIAELSNVQVVAASRTNRDALEAFAQRFKVKGYTDYREVLDDKRVDVALIATPHHLHTEITIEAAQAGKHILLEKPMAPTLAECDRILQAVAETQVKLMVGHTNQFAPAYVAAKEMVESGEMGDIVMGISTMSKFWFEPNRRPWHLDQTTGGGMWRTAGMHCLDRLTWLVDSPVSRVCAQFGTRFHEQQADDAGMIFLRYENGTVGTVVSTGYRTGAPKHLTELTCTEGMLNIDYITGVTIGRDEKWQTVPETGSENWMHEALVGEWRAFADAIRFNKESPVTGAYARHIMAVVFAAEESSRLRQEVPVPLVDL
jgi:predicted dehydrogenase